MKSSIFFLIALAAAQGNGQPGVPNVPTSNPNKGTNRVRNAAKQPCKTKNGNQKPPTPGNDPNVQTPPADVAPTDTAPLNPQPPVSPPNSPNDTGPTAQASLAKPAGRPGVVKNVNRQARPRL